MSDGNEKVELSYEERISACKALEAELKENGITAEIWTTPKKGANDPGVGVALFGDDGEQQASVTVDGSSVIRVRKVLDTLPGTAQAAKFAKALRIPKESFIPDGKFCKSTDVFGGFRKFGKRA